MSLPQSALGGFRCQPAIKPVSESIQKFGNMLQTKEEYSRQRQLIEML
jgi:hypothetical protein